MSSKKAKVETFSVELEYDRTMFEPLKAKAITYRWIKKKKKARWTFHVNQMDEVIAIIQKPISFDARDFGLREILKHCPNGVKVIKRDRVQGKGYINVSKSSKLKKDRRIDVFKIEFPRNKKNASMYVPVECVKKMWGVVKKYDTDDVVPSRLNAEHYCKAMGITRFNSKKGWFDYDKFFGSRKDYFKWYAAIKVLQSYKVIEHQLSGNIIRCGYKLDLEEPIKKSKMQRNLDDFVMF